MQANTKSAWILTLGVALSAEACNTSSDTQAPQGASESLQTNDTSDYWFSAYRDDDRNGRSRNRRRRLRSRRGNGSAAGASAAGSGAAGHAEGAAGVSVEPVAGTGGTHGVDPNAPSAAGSGGAGKPAVPVSGTGGDSGGRDPGAGGAAGSDTPTAPTQPTTPSTAVFAPGQRWQYQLDGRLDTSVDAQVFDIDLFDNTAESFAALHAAGRKVICYFDTAYEPGRPDSDKLAPFRGNPIDGWPDQAWVDQREPAVLAVLRDRIAQAKDKGCDAIEADDVDARDNDPGFPLTAADQRAFITALAEAAHKAGLKFGLKNALDDVSALVSVADFAINEECIQFDECDLLVPFIASGKAVYHVEYTEDDFESLAQDVCDRSNALGFDTVLKHLDLDAPLRACK
jgi:hypothetical protein